MKSQAYICKKCKTTETIMDRQDGIRLTEITCVYCPICAAKGRKRKMDILIDDKGGKTNNGRTI